jgi:hypothetical protein
VLAVQESETICELPVREMTAGEFVALLATEALPEALPFVVGVYVTVSVAVWFGVKVSPDVTPLVVKPAPVGVTPEIVMFEFPLFVRVTFKALLLPILTLPKFKLVGFAPRRKVAATPVPLTGIERGEPEALFVSDTDPLTSPVDVGEKTILNVEFLPTAMEVGSVRPLMLTPAPVGLAAEIVRVAVPLLVTVIVCELLVPVVTFPKLTVVGLVEICG